MTKGLPRLSPDQAHRRTISRMTPGTLGGTILSARPYLPKAPYSFEEPIPTQALWVGSSTDDMIYEVATDGTELSSRAAPVSGFVEGLVWFDGFLYVSDSSFDTVYKTDPDDGSTISSWAFSAFDASAGGGEGLTTDGTTMWISDSITDKVYVVDPADGSSSSNFSHPASTNIRGICFDGTDLRLLHRGTTTGTVYRFSTAGTEQDSFALGFAPVDIAFDGTDLWIADSAAAVIRRFTTAGVDTGDDFPMPGSNVSAMTYGGPS